MADITFTVSEAIDASESLTYTAQPPRISRYEGVFTNDYFDKLEFSVLYIRDPDRNTLKEDILTKDRLPLIGASPFNATPESSISDKPWFFVQLSFGGGKGAYLTYGKDIEVVKAAGTKLLFQGRLLEEINVHKELGDELFGSIVFPEVSLRVDNSDGFYDFLNTDFSSAYGGRIIVWRWDPVSSTMIEEYTGVVTGFTTSDQSVSLSFSPDGAALLDKILPPPSGTDIINQATQNQKLFPRYFGRNLNVPCSNIKASDEGESPLYEYFAGLGRNRISRVRREGEVVQHVDDIDPDYTEHGWQSIYDSSRDLTYLKFQIRQTDGNGNLYAMTADIEGVGASVQNLVKSSEDFEDTNVWTRQGVGVISENLQYSPDSIKSATYFSGPGGGVDGELWQETTLVTSAVTDGLFGYICVKDFKLSDLDALNILNIQTKGHFTTVGTDNWSLGLKKGTWSGGTVVTPDSNGTFNLGNGWNVLWYHWPGQAEFTAGSTVTFRLIETVARDNWIWGAFLMNSYGTTTQDLDRCAYEKTWDDGYASNRNFAYNIKELLINSQYGLGQYTFDDDSFIRAATVLFKRNLYCDGGLLTENSARTFFDFLMQPGNTRLERKDVFRSWVISIDDTRDTNSPLEFGLGDNNGLNNIISFNEIESKSSFEYPQGINFECVPERDWKGNLAFYKRKRKYLNTDIDYGRILTLNNNFVRYELVADILLEQIRKKLLNGLVSFSFTTNEFYAWNLELDDIVKIYYPAKGINGVLYEVTGLQKGISAVTVKVRSYNNDTYIYTGTFPKDRDADNTSFEKRSTGSQGSAGAPLSEIGGPDDTVTIPTTGYAKVYVRKTSGAPNSQELVIIFADGSTRVLAHSDQGSIGEQKFYKTTQLTSIASPAVIFAGGYSWPHDGVNTKPFIDKAALINNQVRPRIIFQGVEQEVNIIKETDLPIPDPTIIGTCHLHAYDHRIYFPSEYDAPSGETNSIVISHEVPGDFTASIGTTVEQSTGSVTYDILKHTGVFLKGLKASASGGDRAHVNLSVVRSANNSLYYLNQFRAIPTFTSWGDQASASVLQFDLFGKNLAEYYCYIGTAALANIGAPQSDSVSSSNLAGYAMDIDSNNIPWVAYTGPSGKSYLAKGTTSYMGFIGLLTEITGIVESKRVTAIAWDTTRNELHICTQSGDVYVLNSDLSFKFNYPLYVVAVTYQYSSITDNFYATVWTDDQPSGWGSNGARGFQIFDTVGTHVTQLKKLAGTTVEKDIFRNADGFLYMMTLDTSNDIVTLSRVNEDLFKKAGYSNVVIINGNLGTASSTYETRAFCAVLPASPLDATQLK